MVRDVERVVPARRREVVMPRVWARRIGRGVVVVILEVGEGVGEVFVWLSCGVKVDEEGERGEVDREAFPRPRV